MDMTIIIIKSIGLAMCTKKTIKLRIFRLLVLLNINNKKGIAHYVQVKWRQ